MAKQREALSRGRIVQGALALIAREGLAQFSTRSLGRELGCEAMSIYHFFPSKQHLLDALVEHAIESMAPPEAGLPALERVRRACYEYRAMAHRYPKLFPLVALHRLNTPAGVRFIERILGMVREATGDDETAARCFRALGYYLIGAGLEETAGYAMGPSAAQPVSDELIAQECPVLARSARYFQRPEWQRTFALGLEALLAAARGGSIGAPSPSGAPACPASPSSRSRRTSAPRSAASTSPGRSPKRRSPS